MSAILSQLKSIGGCSRPATRSPGAAPVANGLAAPATFIETQDPVGDVVQWINHQRRRVDAPRAGMNRGVMKPTREQAVAMNRVVPKRVAPAPPASANGETAKVQKGRTEPSFSQPVIESDDELFDLLLPGAARAPAKTLLQLFDEERAFQHAPELPVQTQAQNTAAIPKDDHDLIEVDLHGGHVNAAADAEEPSAAAMAPTGLKSALRQPDAARRESKPRVRWHPDVRDTKFASVEGKGGRWQRTTDPELLEIQADTRKNEVLQQFGRLAVDDQVDEGRENHAFVTGEPTLARSPARREKFGDSASSASPASKAATLTGRERRNGIKSMLGRMVKLPRKLWR